MAAEAEGAQRDQRRIGAMPSVRRSAKARTLARARMPRLVLEARRIAANVIHGLHGRRRAGAGENFWQYRRFVSGEPSQSVDWRRSARDDHLYVREQEWEAAHTVWLWPDRSPSMAFASSQARDSKLERALIVRFALAEVLVAGRRARRHSRLMRPTASRNIIDKMAQAMLHDTRRTAEPAAVFLPPRVFRDRDAVGFLVADRRDSQRSSARLSATGAHGHVVQIVDPAEESFPYSGRIEFVEPEGGGSITAGRAESWRSDYQRARRASPRANSRRDRPARLELCRPPHRPAGSRTVAAPACAHGRAALSAQCQRPARAVSRESAA